MGNSSSSLGEGSLLSKWIFSILRTHGYDPDQIYGVEKEELVEKIHLLSSDPSPSDEDEFPMPLYSNCWIQFWLRLVLLVATWIFFGSFVLTHLQNFIALSIFIAGLSVRNVRLRKLKQERQRKRR